MPGTTGDEIVTQKHKRNFIQFGGARPINKVAYAGQDGQYMVLDGVSAPELAGVDPIYAPDPRRPGQYRLIGKNVKPATLAKGKLTLHERHGSIPRQLGTIGCAFNLYEATGACKDLSDFLGGWSDYVLIYPGCTVTEKDFGARSTWNNDDPINDALSFVMANPYPVGSLAFGTVGPSVQATEITDVVYGGFLQCGDCGAPDDGTQRIYASAKSSGAGSPGLQGSVQYSLDGGATWTVVVPTGIGASEDPIAVAVVGQRLLVLTKTAGGANSGGYYYTNLSTIGAPTTWTKVTAGFVNTKAPNDVWVQSPREVYFAGDGGYLYKATDITAGVTVLNAGVTTANNLLRIAAQDDTIVATGASATVVKSINRGATFANTTTAPAVSGNAQAIAVLDKQRYWVGFDSGRIYYTNNGGETWAEKIFANSGAGVVRDIEFATDEVGFFSFDTVTPTAQVWSTWNGGQDWSNASPRVLNVPLSNRFNRLAVPIGVDATTASNSVLAAGLGASTTLGLMALGVASRI